MRGSSTLSADDQQQVIHLEETPTPTQVVTGDEDVQVTEEQKEEQIQDKTEDVGGSKGEDEAQISDQTAAETLVSISKEVSGKKYSSDEDDDDDDDGKNCINGNL